MDRDRKSTTHTFRHAFCSFIANRGVPTLLALKISGRSSIDMFNTYHHAGEQELVDARRVDFNGITARNPASEMPEK